MPRKWIRQEIESLDPKKDYERIWKLSISYQIDSFIMNLLYAAMFPNIIVPEQAARPVWREDGGKVLHKSTHRAQQTGNFVALLSWYGVSDGRSRNAIAHVNALHTHWMKKYPSDFTDANDFIYTLCTFATLQHRMFLMLGLQGISEKERIAAHLFWKDVSKLFVMEDGQPVSNFPGSWDGIISYMESVESTRVPASKQAKLTAEAFFDQFAFRYFPPGFRWLGRMVPISLSMPTTLEALRIPPNNQIISWIIRQIVALWLIITFTWLPDPTEAYWEIQEGLPRSEKDAKVKQTADFDKGFVKYFSERHKSELQTLLPRQNHHHFD